MELLPVAVTTVLVAIAGALGITLGWWLGRRGERERQQREERKSAYVAFVHAAIRYRNAPDLSADDRHAVYIDMWERNRAFTRLARSDLGVAAADPWEGIEAVVGETIDFRLPADR